MDVRAGRGRYLKTRTIEFGKGGGREVFCQFRRPFWDATFHPKTSRNHAKIILGILRLRHTRKYVNQAKYDG